jgi:hypothetical protein
MAGQLTQVAQHHATYPPSELLHGKGVAGLAQIIRTFGDAAGKDSDQTGYVNLVCHSAPIEQWEPFERAWREVCKDFGVCALHTTDIMTVPHRGEYADWGDNKADCFLESLLRLFPGDHNQLKGVACAVSVEGHRRAAQKTNLPPIEKICVAYCIRSVGVEFPEDDLSFIFDKGEKCRHYADDLWRTPGPITDRIVELDALMPRVSPALQSTDLTAWLARTHWIRTPEKFPSARLQVMSDPSVGKIYYYDSIRFEEPTLLAFDFDRLIRSL